MHCTLAGRLACLLAAAALLALAGCGAGAGPALAPPPQPPALDLLPSLVELPDPQFADLARGTSAVFNLDLTQGNLRNATAGANSLQLTSTASANSAAFYGLEPTYNAKRIPYIAPYSVTFTTDGAGDVWLAHSNYKTGRWEIDQTPISAAGTFSTAIYLDSDAGSPTGEFWFAFISSRGEAPTISDVAFDYPDAPAVATDPVEYRQFVVAADNVTRLATSIYLPYEETSPFIPNPPYPAVLVRTPYDKAQVDPALINTGTSINVAVVIQYWRGRLDDTGNWPDSDGTEGLFDDHAGPAHSDALDTVAWLEERLWYNGDLAVTGPSALGLATYQAATQLGTRIQAMYTQISAADVAQWVMLENGCLGQYNVESFLLANGFPAGHLQTVLDAFTSGDQLFFDGYDYNDQASAMNAPGYHETGWWDVDVNETIRSWQAFNTAGAAEAAGAQVLVIGPWTHAGIRADSAGDLAFPNSGDINDPQVIPDGFDGIEFLLYALGRNPFFTPPASAVCYYMVGPEGLTTGNNNKWLTSADWPPAGLPTLLYLSAGGILSDIPPPAASSETYHADPADPIGTVGGGLLPFGALAAGPLDSAPLLAETAGSFLTYESTPLVGDMPVAGDIALTVRLELDSAVTSPLDTDVAAWLIDEDALGNQLIVANGIVRLSDYLVGHGGGTVGVDTPYNVTFSLGSRAYNFATGHKLVLYVAGSNSPQYAVNPGNGEALVGGSASIAQDVNLLLGDAAGQCQLLLPVLGP